MKKALAYIRVSTEGQDKEDKFGKEAQREMINKYAKENDYEIIEYLEDTISGVKEDRPEFDKLLTDYNDIDVIVAKTDRISRDTKLYYYYVMLLEKRNIRLISVQENFEEFGEFSNIIKSFVLFVAEQERKNIARRTSGGRIVKAKKGSYSGGRSPYGYHIENGELVIDEQEKTIVELIFDLKAKGLGYSAIARELEEQGFKTRSGGLKWQPKTIQKILGNSVYTGVYHYSGIEVQGTHQTFIK